MQTAIEALVWSCEHVHFSPGGRWDHYAWADLLLEGDWLRRGLAEGLKLGAANELECAWTRLSSPEAKDALWDFLGCYLAIPAGENGAAVANRVEACDLERLYRHSLGLVASARAALAHRRLAAGGPIEDLFRRWRETANLLGEPWPGVAPGASTPMTIADWDFFVHENSWTPPATVSWTQYWLKGNLATSGRSVRVPFAVYYPSGGSTGDSREGYILHLAAETCCGAPGVLFEHPSSCLYILSKKWVDTVRLAAGYIQRARRTPQDEPPHTMPLPEPTAWRIEMPPDAPGRQRVLDGDSHGGAAARAFQRLRDAQVADSRVLVMARIELLSGWPEDRACLALGKVGGIPAKICAAARDESIDTVAVVEGENEQDAMAALQKHDPGGRLSLAVLGRSGVSYTPSR